MELKEIKKLADALRESGKQELIYLTVSNELLIGCAIW